MPAAPAFSIEFIIMQQTCSFTAKASFTAPLSGAGFQALSVGTVGLTRARMTYRNDDPDGRRDLYGDRPEDWERYEPQGWAVWQPTKLLNEVSRLYDAQSFLTWRYGEFFNTHVTITPRLMWIEDHREFAKLMVLWNKEMKRWLAVGNDKPRQR